jgi:peptide/nickel transport system permease protein
VTRYLLRRALLAVPLLLALATLLFLLLEAAPGRPGELLLRPGLTAEVTARIQSNLGLDQPLPVRYLRWIGSLLRGDLGYSYSFGAPVVTVIGSVLPNTLLLAGLSLVLAFLSGVTVGVYQAFRRGTVADGVLSTLVLLLYSVPSFWLGILLILVFSWGAANVWDLPFFLPASGAASVGAEYMPAGEWLLDRLAHLVLPTATLTLALAAGVARYARNATLEVLEKEYVLAARARGLPARVVVVRHVLPNALLPLITVFGLYLPVLFSGAVFVETVFAWPGMGLLMVDAVQARDYPLILGGGFLFGVVVVAGNLLADLLYALADPRVRYD